MRRGSGFDPVRPMSGIEACNRAALAEVRWLIKWNPRSTDAAALAARLDVDAATRWEHRRAGERVTLWEQDVSFEGIQRPVRRVLRSIERRIDKHGPALIAPELALEGWTSLPARFGAKEIIALYADHGTHEQFHSEFKPVLSIVEGTDLDLKGLPSGKFDTNNLVCQLVELAMNILRLMGPGACSGPRHRCATVLSAGASRR